MQKLERRYMLVEFKLRWAELSDIYVELHANGSEYHHHFKHGRKIEYASDQVQVQYQEQASILYH